eukprot:TRINITY_DN3244_c0_g2_i1.p1 TRINITY_DN3244_c0_g2~~TRINITY_DN3244_c0_g2_i1.p1  ORF type:complete len:390 (-),score=85.01 TRINITY_DN3244_c0_g2_i1:44-1183(-)
MTEKKDEVEKITLFKHPLITLKYFSIVAGIFVKDTILFLKNHKVFTQIFIPLVIILVSLYFIPGAHQPVVRSSEEAVLFAFWWIGLGILSSIGLGTGLHTFVLYLGPHIAKVAMTATECNSTDFDTYGEESFLCPTTVAATSTVTLWSIIHKVQLESFLWGAGTAIGELPPYFVARAARLSGKELQEFEELKDQHTFMNRAKAFALQILEKFGFFGILIFASIPNPLFDLAGLVCGHLIPFMTFFGATLIGKAVIKVHLQMIFVIILFHKETIDKVVHYVEQLLPSLKGGLHSLLETERKKLHEPHHHTHGENKSVFSYVWNLLIFVMVGYFVVSLIDSSVQNYLSSQQQKVHENESSEKKKKQKKNKTGKLQAAHQSS